MVSVRTANHRHTFWLSLSLSGNFRLRPKFRLSERLRKRLSQKVKSPSVNSSALCYSSWWCQQCILHFFSRFTDLSYFRDKPVTTQQKKCSTMTATASVQHFPFDCNTSQETLHATSSTDLGRNAKQCKYISDKYLWPCNISDHLVLHNDFNNINGT